MTDRSGPFPLLLRGALVVLIVMLPIEVGVILDEAPGIADGYGRLVVFSPFDLALVVVALTGIPVAVRMLRARSFSWGISTLLVITAGAAVALVFNVNPRGWVLLARLVALTIAACVIVDLSPGDRTRIVVTPLVATVAVQSVIGVAQVWNGEPIGLLDLGEREARFFYKYEGVLAAQGTTIHGYVLAGFSMLAATLAVATASRSGASRSWLAAVAICAIPLGLTYSRMALVGTALVIAALAWGVRRHPVRYALPTAILIVAIAIPAVLALDGWTGRRLNKQREGLDRLTTGRVTLLREASTMIGDNPLVGVGPGNYVVTVETEYEVDIPKEVHAVPVLIAAEDGAIWGLATLVMLAGVGIMALRAGPATTALFVGFLPFWIFDKFPYTHPNGLVLTALWLAMLESLSRQQLAQEPSAQVTAASA